jgi:pyrroloquinoline-quinone synthase
MERKHHWAWPHLSGPDSTRAQLLVHYQQEYLTYVRDFPLFLGRLHGRSDDVVSRRLLAENIYEEETGGISKTGPHPELFLHMMKGLGFSRRLFDSTTPLPGSIRYRAWLDRATTSEPWAVGAAVITIFVEGSVHERDALNDERSGAPPRPYNPRRDPLARHQGLSTSYLTLKKAHAMVENGHRLAAWRMVERHAGEKMKQRIIGAMETSLDLWLGFRDGVASAAGLVRPASVR